MRALACIPAEFPSQFVFEMPPDVVDPLAIDEPVHIVLVRSASSSDTPELVAAHALRWRELVLGRHHGREGRLSSVEVKGAGSAMAVPAGVLELRAHLHRDGEHVAFDEAAARHRIHASTEAATRQDRLFLLYAKQWWKEYVDIRPSHRERAVKIFAPDESGSNRLICLAISPVMSGRLVDTPTQAARFVSLLPHEVARGVGRGRDGGAKVEQWSHPHTTLSRGCGDVEDHATLLCGLFLGLGLDA